MFGMGFGEITAIVIIAVIVFGPDKLPALAKQAAGFVKMMRKMTTDAKAELRKELGDDFNDLGLNDLRSLDPRQMVRDALADDPTPAPAVAPTTENTYLADGTKAPYDDEAT